MEKIIKDYNFVIRVLNSSTNKTHLENSRKLFINFMKKWSSSTSYLELFLFRNEFNNTFKQLEDNLIH